MFTSQIIAHRGDCQYAIENTVYSLLSALKQGIKLIEIDVQLSKDGLPVLFHDRNLERLVGMPQAVAECDWIALKQLKLKSYHLKTHPGECNQPIPTLKEVVSLIAQFPDAQLFVEVKRVNFDFFSYRYVYQQISIELEPIKQRCVYLSFSYRFLRLCQIKGESNLAYVLPSWSQFNAKMLMKLQPAFIFCKHEIVPAHYRFLNDEFMWVLYEITDLAILEHYYQRGVRYFESFNPVQLNKELQHAAL